MSRTAQAATHGSVGVVELTHAEARARLSDFLDGSLSDNDRRGVESHLAACRGCAAYCATLKATLDATARLPRPVVPRGARSKVLDYVREHKDSENGK
jgi:anti-sigma factor RsiW